MKPYTLAIGFGLGYLAGNETARRKALDLIQQAKESRQGKAVESRVSDTVTDLTSRVDPDMGISDPSYMGSR
jgi:hypothetical protein